MLVRVKLDRLLFSTLKNVEQKPRYISALYRLFTSEGSNSKFSIVSSLNIPTFSDIVIYDEDSPITKSPKKLVKYPMRAIYESSKKAKARSFNHIFVKLVSLILKFIIWLRLRRQQLSRPS